MDSDNASLRKLPIDEDDIAFIFEDLHRGRSVIPPHEVPVRPVLVRWDIDAALSLQNCVVMDVGDAEKHLKEHGEGKAASEVWGQETQDLVAKRVEEVSRYLQWNGD